LRGLFSLLVIGEILMTSHARINTFSRGLALVSAIFVFQATGVLAGNLVGDAQTQASDLLSGTVGGKAKTSDPSAVIPAGSAQTPNLDSQAQARRLILGVAPADGNATREQKVEPQMTATSNITSRDNRTYADPQESARRMILGSRNNVAARALNHSVSLTQDPLVIRLSKDEFRIAFAIRTDRCGLEGCNGVIPYRVDWKTEDGTTYQETKRVLYSVSPGANRAIVVDRQYFDTAEGQHTTDVVNVGVDYLSSRRD
jgi:hypothetical protein